MNRFEFADKCGQRRGRAIWHIRNRSCRTGAHRGRTGSDPVRFPVARVVGGAWSVIAAFRREPRKTPSPLAIQRQSCIASCSTKALEIAPSAATCRAVKRRSGWRGWRVHPRSVRQPAASARVGRIEGQRRVGTLPARRRNRAAAVPADGFARAGEFDLAALCQRPVARHQLLQSLADPGSSACRSAMVYPPPLLIRSASSGWVRRSVSPDHAR